MEGPRTPANTPSREPMSSADTVLSQVFPTFPSTTVHATNPRRTTHHFERRQTSRVPTCTHTTMNRLYGPHKCHMCGKVPAIGWVYSCQQDRMSQHQHSPTECEVLPAVDDGDSYFEAQAKIAESLAMSKSVITQMRQGQYTYDQMEILLDQRRHVLDVIRNGNASARSSTPSHSVPSSTPPADETIIATAGMTTAPTQVAAPALQRTSTDQAPTPSKAKDRKSTCTYQVCHHCRPFLQDRLPTSFEPIIHDEIPALTDAEVTKLPLRDAEVLKRIGLRTPPPVTPPAAVRLDAARVSPSPLGLFLESDGSGGAMLENGMEGGEKVGLLEEEEGSSESDSSISLDTESDEELGGGVAV